MPFSYTSSCVKKAYSLPVKAERAFLDRNTFLRWAFANTSRLCSRQGAETFFSFSCLGKCAVENLGGGNQRTISSEFQNKLCLKAAPSAHTCTKGQHIGLRTPHPSTSLKRQRGSDTHTHTHARIPLTVRNRQCQRREEGPWPKAGGGTSGEASWGSVAVSVSVSPSVYISLCINKVINH